MNDGASQKKTLFPCEKTRDDETMIGDDGQGLRRNNDGAGPTFSMLKNKNRVPSPNTTREWATCRSPDGDGRGSKPQQPTISCKFHSFLLPTTSEEYAAAAGRDFVQEEGSKEVKACPGKISKKWGKICL
jgi:hypothetical protein